MENKDQKNFGNKKTKKSTPTMSETASDDSNKNNQELNLHQRKEVSESKSEKNANVVAAAAAAVDEKNESHNESQQQKASEIEKTNISKSIEDKNKVEAESKSVKEITSGALQTEQSTDTSQEILHTNQLMEMAGERTQTYINIQEARLKNEIAKLREDKKELETQLSNKNQMSILFQYLCFRANSNNRSSSNENLCEKTTVSALKTQLLSDANNLMYRLVEVSRDIETIENSNMSIYKCQEAGDKLVKIGADVKFVEQMADSVVKTIQVNSQIPKMRRSDLNAPKQTKPNAAKQLSHIGAPSSSSPRTDPTSTLCIGFFTAHLLLIVGVVFIIFLFYWQDQVKLDFSLKNQKCNL